jgi:hypothetical protein
MRLSAAHHAQRDAAAARTSQRRCGAKSLRAFLPFAAALYKPNAVYLEKISSRLRVSRILLPMSHRKVKNLIQNHERTTELNSGTIAAKREGLPKMT